MEPRQTTAKTMILVAICAVMGVATDPLAAQEATSATLKLVSQVDEQKPENAKDEDAGEEDAENEESEEVEDECEDDSCGEDEGEEEEDATLLGEKWHRRGPLSAEYFYTGEVFTNARGGISTKRATRYRGNFDLTLRWNTEEADWWKGGEFFVYAQHSHGTTLTPRFVGDGQFYSNIDTGTLPQDLTQLGEYWYKHTFSDKRLSTKLGRQDANADFAFADLGGDFINSSFVTLPNIPMPFWPFQTVGASAFYEHSDKLHVAGGVYDSGGDHDQWWVDTAGRGLFLICHVQYEPSAGVEGARKTMIRLGMWRLTNDVYSNDGETIYDGDYGFYGTLDHLLVREADSEDQGLGVFFQTSWAPPDRNQIDRHFGGGITYRGLLNGRDEDTCGFGCTLIDFAGNLNELTGQTYECATELFYKYRFDTRAALQPDIQYITHPMGLERDALVAGVRFELTL